VYGEACLLVRGQSSRCTDQHKNKWTCSDVHESVKMHVTAKSYVPLYSDSQWFCKTPLEINSLLVYQGLACKNGFSTGKDINIWCFWSPRSPDLKPRDFFFVGLFNGHNVCATIAISRSGTVTQDHWSSVTSNQGHGGRGVRRSGIWNRECCVTRGTCLYGIPIGPVGHFRGSCMDLFVASR
jgi:hypothetical protein